MCSGGGDGSFADKASCDDAASSEDIKCVCVHVCVCVRVCVRAILRHTCKRVHTHTHTPWCAGACWRSSSEKADSSTRRCLHSSKDKRVRSNCSPDVLTGSSSAREGRQSKLGAGNGGDKVGRMGGKMGAGRQAGGKIGSRLAEICIWLRVAIS